MADRNTKPKVVKKPRKKPVNKGGRPTVITDDVVRNLERSLQNGFTVRKACQLAKISPDTYYKHCEKKPAFSDRMDDAQRWAEEKARQNVVKAIDDGDIQSSRWYLERKVKNEFGTRTEITGPDNTPLDSGKDDIKAIAAGINKLLEEDKQDEPTGSPTSGEAVS